MEAIYKNKKEKGSENLLSQMWFRYFPYWPLFILLLLLSILGTWFYLRYTIPMYESTATILIKDEHKGLDDSKMMESLNMLATKKIIENEIEVLRSRSLMIEVVKKLHLYAPVSEEGKLVSHSAYLMSPVRIQVLNPDSVKEIAKVYFSFDQKKQQVVIGNDHYSLSQWVATAYGTLRFVKNNNSPIQKKWYFSLIDPRKLTQSMVKGVDISSASKLSTVIYLKLRDEVPKRAEDILNELVVAYSKAAIDDKNSLAVNTLSFVEDRLNFVAHDLDSIEHKIQQFKANKGAIDIGTQGKMFLQNVGENDQKLGDINMQLAVLDQVEQYVVSSKDSKGGIVPSTLGIIDPLLSQLLEKLYNSELEFERLRKTTGENSPILVSLSDQISRIKPGVLENIQSHRASLEAGRKNLFATNNSYNSLLQTIPQKEKELVEISREQSIKNNIYTFLLQKREEAALSHSSTVADSRVIDRAESSLTPVSPNRKLMYIIAVAGSFAFVILLLAANEMLSKTILFRQEIENYTSIPIIAEIPYEKLKSQLVIGKGENTFITEQFRRLRASLPHLGISGKRKKVLITSTIPGEGKSFVAVNLAVSLAMIGKKVILLEFDLSHPTLSEKLDQYHEKGLSDYLKGEAEPEEVIKRTTMNENLFFISSGELPANPSELIMNDKTGELLSYLDSIFDYVIVDAAPAGPSSDAYMLSPLCDATLYIIRHKYTPKVLIQRLDENNMVTNLKNIAIIFNGIRSRGFKKDNYGYGFGYGYGHNYNTAKSKYSKHVLVKYMPWLNK
jgi:tyrosine-protein kinase Etk/Wzc